jgi:PAS domain S-box-containing protein
MLQRKPGKGQQADELGLVESAINTMRQNLLLEMDTVRLAQKALAHSENRFRTLVTNIPGIVYRCELLPPWNVLYISETVTEVTGFPVEIFLRGDRGLGQCIHPEDLDWVTEEMQQHVAAGTPYAHEYRILHEDGSVRWVFEKGVPIADHQQQPLWLDGVILDITELKQAQKHNEELERKFLQAQKMESIGRLAGGVAHDFNNMLGVIIGYAEIALEKLPVHNPVQAELASIKTAAERSAALTQQLLAFARKQTIAPKVIDLNTTVADMLPMLRRLIGEDIDLAWIPGNSPWMVKADPTQMDQILVNLCVNARDAITGVGKIVVATENCTLETEYCAAHPGFLPGEYVRLSVSDNGCGMDQEVRAQIFDPFFTTKGLGKGTGLGLATVYGAVKQNNGFVNVYSEPGKGSVFSIYLPRHGGDSKQRREEDTPNAAIGGHETILVVEDEIAILGMATSMLQQLGYTVLTATSPNDALLLAEEHSGTIDLLLTDVIMPEMNGRALADRILTIQPGTKLLFMSGYTADIIAHQSVLAAGIHFLQKPFTRAVLAANVRQALDD